VHIILGIAAWNAKVAQSERVKRDWEIIADNLSKAGWSWGCKTRCDAWPAGGNYHHRKSLTTNERLKLDRD
jgi:hypothetical protein